MIMQLIGLVVVLATLVMATVQNLKGGDWQWWGFISLFNLIVALGMDK